MKLKPGYKKILILLLTVLLAEYVAAKLIYNKLVDEEHFLHIAYGRLEAEKQRRHDIITRSVAAVNKYVDMESRVLERLATLNGLIESRASESMQHETKTEIILLLNGLTLLAEDYPDLRSKGPYVHLMETLQETGKRVTEERMNYNKTAYEYNMFCRLFPFNIFARMFGFGKKPFFEAEKGAGTVPEIKEL
jgi:LemA protein